MGRYSEGGFIRSYGKTSLGAGKGFYLDGKTGNFTFGDSGGNRIEWDGTNLEVFNSPIEVDLISENTLSATFRVYNRTNSTRTVYVSNRNYLHSDNFLSNGTISGNSYKDVTVDTDFGLKKKIRFYLSGHTGVIVTHYVSNPTISYQRTAAPSISGGTNIQCHAYDVSYQDYVSGNTITYRVYQGILDITSVEGIATLTVYPSLHEPIVTASISSTSSAGSGVDTVYVSQGSTNYTGTFRFQHDYSGSSRYRTVYYRIMGYVNS